MRFASTIFGLNLRKKVRLFRFHSLWMASILLFTGCGSMQPIQIGLVAELSGRNAALGVQGRNGSQLAVDEINGHGGVVGRALELVVRDDIGSLEEFNRMERELIDSPVVALTGHYTSWESLAAVAMFNQHDLLLISPTTSTSELSGIKDRFYRLVPASDVQSRLLASYLIHDLALLQAAVIFESDNAAFAAVFADNFIKEYSTLGGEITTRASFSVSKQPDYAAIIRQAHSAGPASALVIVASAVDTALLAQQAHLQDWPVQIASSNWAYTNDLLQNGGQAVQGMLLTSQFNSQCQQPGYLEFQRSYSQKFGQQPAFAATFAYETLHLLARALETTGGKPDGLGEAILANGQFRGLCGDIRMDEFGDVQRSLYLMTVNNGQFEVIKTIDPIP